MSLGFLARATERMEWPLTEMGKPAGGAVWGGGSRYNESCFGRHERLPESPP